MNEPFKTKEYQNKSLIINMGVFSIKKLINQKLKIKKIKKNLRLVENLTSVITINNKQINTNI